MYHQACFAASQHELGLTTLFRKLLVICKWEALQKPKQPLYFGKALRKFPKINHSTVEQNKNTANPGHLD